MSQLLVGAIAKKLDILNLINQINNNCFTLIDIKIWGYLHPGFSQFGMFAMNEHEH